jgi:hypothetical protein
MGGSGKGGKGSDKGAAAGEGAAAAGGGDGGGGAAAAAGGAGLQGRWLPCGSAGPLAAQRPPHHPLPTHTTHTTTPPQTPAGKAGGKAGGKPGRDERRAAAAQARQEQADLELLMMDDSALLDAAKGVGGRDGAVLCVWLGAVAVVGPWWWGLGLLLTGGGAVLDAAMGLGSAGLCVAGCVCGCVSVVCRSGSGWQGGQREPALGQQTCLCSASRARSGLAGAHGSAAALGRRRRAAAGGAAGRQAHQEGEDRQKEGGQGARAPGVG